MITSATIALPALAIATLWRLFDRATALVQLHGRCIVVVVLAIDGNLALDQLLHLAE